MDSNIKIEDLNLLEAEMSKTNWAEQNKARPRIYCLYCIHICNS